MIKKFFSEEFNLVQVLKLIFYSSIGVVGFLKVNAIIHLLQEQNNILKTLLIK